MLIEVIIVIVILIIAYIVVWAIVINNDIMEIKWYELSEPNVNQLDFYYRRKEKRNEWQELPEDIEKIASVEIFTQKVTPDDIIKGGFFIRKNILMQRELYISDIPDKPDSIKKPDVPANQGVITPSEQVINNTI